MLRSNLNVVYRCTYHVVWCVKYRRKLLSADVERRLKQIAQQVADERRCAMLEMQADQDHFQMRVECDPQFGIHRLVKAIKGRSSRLLRQEFSLLRTRVPTLWTNSYFVATVGSAPLAAVKQYIASQKCN